jgi:hypothetical protein
MHPAPNVARLHLFQRMCLLIVASLFAFSLLLQASRINARAQTAGNDPVPTLLSSAPTTVSPAPKPANMRVVALRQRETKEGARLTLTSDAPLDDYSSYVEGERLFVLVPLTALAGAQGNWSGRGFSDLRVEPRERDILLSFRLQVGASVHLRQHFNRLDIAFSVNEQESRAVNRDK